MIVQDLTLETREAAKGKNEMNEANDIQAGFIRQRRNLMIVSLVLLFAESAELTIQELNIFGNVLHLAHPATVTYALWIGWAYWLWRYYVYFHDLGDKGLKGAHLRRLDKTVIPIALFQLKRDKEFMESLGVEGKAKLYADSNMVSMYRRSPWKYVIKITVQAASRRGDKVTYREIGLESYVVNTRWLLALAHIRAWADVLLRTRLLSEYFLPYAVAAAPFVYKVATLAR